MQKATGRVKMKKPKKCPECKSDKVVRIIYGYRDSEIAELEEKGEAEWSGCEISNGSPLWSCKKCGYKWNGLYFPKLNRPIIEQKPLRIRFSTTKPDLKKLRKKYPDCKIKIDKTKGGMYLAIIKPKKTTSKRKWQYFRTN